MSQSLATLLAGQPLAEVDVPATAWGFGGLHGGLALSLIAAASQPHGADQPLRSIAGQFHRPIRDTFRIDSQVMRAGRSVQAVHATGSGAAGVCVTATAIFGAPQKVGAPVLGPTPPDVPRPEAVPLLPDLPDVPVLSQVEVRPVGSIQPYVGRSEPTMTAWMRVKGTDRSVDTTEVIFFLDALPPSYTALMAEQRPVPTLEFTAHLTSHRSTSSWALIHSRTVTATPDGWVTEHIDVWDANGTHLGSGRQLRLAI